MNDHRKLRLGLEAGHDPSWPAGLLYVENLARTLASLPAEERPSVRLLPINVATVDAIRELGELPDVEIAVSIQRRKEIVQASLIARRFLRKFVQPLLRRPLPQAYKSLDVTFPGWGKPLPGTPQIQWIPDLQHVHLPHLFSASELRERDRRIRAIAESEGTVIFSSSAALEDFLRLHRSPRVTCRVWRFASAAADESAGGRDPRQVYEVPQSYLYVGNQFWAHKDHLTIFKALLLLREKGLRPTVVCTGVLDDARDPSYTERVRRFLAENRLDDQVRILGFITRRDQVQILRYSSAVLQPSLFEGWSTVIEDARAIGRPVVASNIDVHLEQIPSAVFFEAGSSQGLAEVLERVLPSLAAGPDPATERDAAAESDARRMRTARDFLRIAEEAVALGKRVRSSP